MLHRLHNFGGIPAFIYSERVILIMSEVY